MDEERNPAEVAAAQRLDLGHYHPLMAITNEETEDSWDLTCYGCEQPIKDKSFYGCKQCQFFLHQSCRDLPPELTHPYHPQHPLTLLPSPPSMGHACDICRGSCIRFIYRCQPCDYDIDMKCATAVLTIQQRINHPSHQHQLMPLLQESMFLCGGCGQEHKGPSFLCTTCGLWINQKCASSPVNLKLNNHHDHTLSLSYFISTEDYKSWGVCEICYETIHRRYWVYRCSECRYFVHFHCAVSAAGHTTNNETEIEQLDSTNSVTAISKVPSLKKDQELIPTLIYLPMPDDSIDIITQLIKNTGVQGKYEEAAKINHRSHEHPLTYFEKPIDHTSCSMTSLSSLLNGARNYEKRNGCAQSISPSAPFYHCVRCHFFLHVWCAELPDKLQHPGHPKHTLSLIPWEPQGNRCNCCVQWNTTLHYSCKECNFVLDCKCASLPRVINHETHKHILALRLKSVGSKCISCSDHNVSLAYTCWGCKLNLCISCALKPQAVRHRYDKHPFTLTYSSLPNQTEDDFCEVEIDSERWFYHCRECNRYLHIGCTFPANTDLNMTRSSVLLPRTIRHKYYEHLFTLTYSPLPNQTEYDFCGACYREIDFKQWFYHCGGRNQYLHTGCIFPADRYSNLVYGITVDHPSHEHQLTGVQPNDNLWCSLCETNHHKYPLALLCSTCEFRLCYECFCNAMAKP